MSQLGIGSALWDHLERYQSWQKATANRGMPWLRDVCKSQVCKQVRNSAFVCAAAPSPTTAVSYLATKCISRHRVAGSLLAPWGPGQCQQIRSFDQPVARMLDANDIVFSVHIPVPGTEMIPWFQYMLLVLQVDVAFRVINQIGKGPCPAVCVGREQMTCETLKSAQ